MGEFFKEEKSREVKKEERLIENPQELFVAYNIIINKIQMMTNEGYDTILPIRAELIGTGQSVDETGQIGNLRKRIQISRISRMEIGIMMWNTLKNIEDLDRWSERYIKYLEEYLDSLQHIAKSSFKIISNLHTEVTKLQNLVNEIRRIPARDSPLPIKRVSPVKIPEVKNMPSIKLVKAKEPPPQEEAAEELPAQEEVPQFEEKQEESDIPALPEIKQVSFPENVMYGEEGPRLDVFNELVDKKVEEYRQARQTGDEAQIEEAKIKLYTICGKNKSLKKRVESLIIRVDMEG